MNRSARHVRRTRLRVGVGAPRHHLAFRLEEALRLTELPGENEGRVYYIRRLRISGLPMDGDRSRWLEQFQRALSGAAELAVRAPDSRAASADFIYFRSRYEALETLLHRLLAAEPLREWYWPLVIGRGQAEGPAGERPDGVIRQDAGTTLVAEVIEQLWQIPAAWTSIAKAVFSAPRLEVVKLLSALPPDVAEEWLAELVQLPPKAGHVGEKQFPDRAKPFVVRAQQALGVEDPRTLWFATLAMLLDYHSDVAAPVAVVQARLALRKLVAADGPARNEPALPSPQSHIDSDVAPVAPARVDSANQLVETMPADSLTVLAEVTQESACPPIETSATCAEVPTKPVAGVKDQSVGPFFVGAPTQAAGLLFLLNVLNRVGIEEALKTRLAVIDPAFPARVLQRLAQYSGVAPEDPVFEFLAAQLAPNSSANVEYLARLWSLAVRRWCWRADHLKVRDIITRAGLFSVNRTDVDVSLPIESVDVQIRRAGLDLDPGWLPWFGRVVRFHYHHRRDRRG